MRVTTKFVYSYAVMLIVISVKRTVCWQIFNSSKLCFPSAGKPQMAVCEIILWLSVLS